MKQKLSMLVACLVTLSLFFTACGNNDNASQKTTSDVGNSSGNITQEPLKAEDGPLTKYNPSIKMNVARSVNPSWQYLKGDDINNNVWYRDYKEKLGIEVINEWTALDSEYSKKLNIAIASGSLPDVFVCNAPQLKQLVEADQLADLTQYYDTYASDLSKRFQSGDNGAALGSATFQGKLYSIPMVGATFYNPSLLWIRMDWLKKLNLSEPKTIDDVLKIAEAFAKNDPDGDGKANTYGISLSNSLFGDVASITGFANGYHAYPDIWLKGSDGKVSFGSIQPEMKMVLNKLREMYKNGLIDKEYGVKDSNKVMQDIVGNRIGLTYGACWNPYLFVTGVQSNPKVEWKAFAPPSADGEIVKASTGFDVGGYTVVRKGYEHPEAAVKMLNEYSEIHFGSRKNEAGIINLVEDGKQIDENGCAVVNSSPANEETVKSINLLLKAIDSEDQSILADCATGADAYPKVLDYMKNGTIANWPTAMQIQAFRVLTNNFAGDRLLMTAFGGQTETMTSKMGILGSLQIETFTKIIMGEASIDEFEKFVDKWNKMGGETITKEINDQLNSQK